MVEIVCIVYILLNKPYSAQELCALVFSLLLKEPLVTLLAFIPTKLKLLDCFQCFCNSAPNSSTIAVFSTAKTYFTKGTCNSALFKQSKHCIHESSLSLHSTSLISCSGLQTAIKSSLLVG